MGTPRWPPCVPWPVQLRHECSLPGEAYVARSAWREARLAALSPPSPRRAAGWCVTARIRGARRPGMRIARYYCPTARETFSLLPDCLASHFPGELDAIEHVVATVEARAQPRSGGRCPAPRHHAAVGGALDSAAPHAGPRWPCSRSSRSCPIAARGRRPLVAVRAALTTTSALVALRTHVRRSPRDPADAARIPAPPRGETRGGAVAPHGMGADRAGPGR